MKAVIYEAYGSPDVLQYTEVPTPSPADDEVLVKIHATAVNPLDRHTLRAEPFFIRLMAGLFKPKNQILGVDIAGIVEHAGKDVTEFKSGDSVFGCVDSGGFAEYVCCKEDKLTLKPDNLTFIDAAGVYVAAATALQALRDVVKVKAGQDILIDGASGGVGTFAVQVAKLFDTNVTAVCGTGKMDIAQSLGADHVLDYTRDDFTRQDKRYDVIFCINGQHSIAEYKRVLKPQGIFASCGGAGRQLFTTLLFGKLLSKISGKQIRFVMAKQTKQDLNRLKDLLATGKIKTVVDKTYPLADTADAIRYLEQGHAIGKVIITMD